MSDSVPEQGPERRGARFTRRRFLQAGGLAGVALAVDALGVEPGRVEVTRHDIVIPGLPPALAGLSIAQVTDTHLPGNRRAADEAIRLLAEARPDVVVLTGDICEDAAGLGALTEFVAAARGALATVGIYGNWERKARIPEVALAAAYERAGAELLVSRSVLVRPPAGDARLRIVGLDDARYVGPDLVRALGGPAGDAELWLVHCPQYADLFSPPADPPAALLAGHTHGGQVRLPGWTPYTPPGSGRYVEGWYRDVPVPMYVSRGVGTAVVPARFACRPELPIFTLRATTAVPDPDSR